MKNEAIATWFLGIAFILIIVFGSICYLANLGYNTYLSVSKERIEVTTNNSNSLH